MYLKAEQWMAALRAVASYVAGLNSQQLLPNGLAIVTWHVLVCDTHNTQLLDPPTES